MRQIVRFAYLLAALLSLSTLWITHASAQLTDDNNETPPPPPPPAEVVGFDPDAVGVVAGYDYVSPREVSAPRRGVPPGRQRYCAFFSYRSDAPPGDAQRPVAPVDGEDYWVVCRWADTGVVAGISLVAPYDPADPTGGQIITETMVTAYMLSLFTFELPTVRFAPPPNNQVVNVETWMGWPEEPDGQTRTAQAGPVWSQGIATPVAVTIDFGSGEADAVVTCSVFEDAYNPELRPDQQRPACSRYTYVIDSRGEPNQRFDATVTVTYEIWVTTSENAAPFLAATVAGPPLAVGMDVAELQAVIR